MTIKEKLCEAISRFPIAPLSGGFVVYEAFEFAGADGVLELADCFGLDLADALAGE